MWYTLCVCGCGRHGEKEGQRERKTVLDYPLGMQTRLAGQQVLTKPLRGPLHWSQSSHSDPCHVTVKTPSHTNARPIPPLGF